MFSGKFCETNFSRNISLKKSVNFVKKKIRKFYKNVQKILKTNFSDCKRMLVFEFFKENCKISGSAKY